MGGPTNHLLSNDLSTDIGQGRGTATLAQSLKRTAFQNGGDPDKALSLAFKRVRLLCDNLGLQRKHYDTACELYKEVSDARVVKGRPIASVVPAIVYIACRREQNPSERCPCLFCFHRQEVWEPEHSVRGEVSGMTWP